MRLRIGMSPKKPELLELLRQSRENSTPAEGRGSKPTQPAPAPSQSETSPSAMPMPSRPRKGGPPAWLPVAVALVVGVPLLWFLSSWAFGEQEVMNATEGPAVEEAETVAPPANPAAETPVADQPEQPIAPPVVASFGVKAITYDFNSRNMELARAVSKALIGRGLPNVQLVKIAGNNGDFLEIFIGKEANKQDLAKLCGTIRVYEYPVGSGQKPFATAEIFALPQTSKP